MYRPEEDPLVRILPRVLSSLLMRAPLQTEMASLRKVLELDFETLYCSHRGLIKHGRAALQERLDYLTEVQARIHELAPLGLSHRQLTRRVLGREGVIYWFSGRIHSKSNLAHKLLSAGAEQQQQQQQQKAAARV